MKMRYLAGLLMALIVPFAALAQSQPDSYYWEGFTAESWVKNTSYATVGVKAVNASNVYQVITAGTSEDADNAGPKTTSTDITDGTVHWKWVGTTAALGIDNTSTAGEVALAQTVPVKSRQLDSLTILASATGTSSDRVLTISCLAKDNTTVLYSFPTVAVAANAKVAVVMRANLRQDPDYIIPWKASTTYRLGERATNDSGKVYEVITAGASAASGGPTGVTADITDNAAHWKYVAVAGASPTGITYLNVTPCPRVKASMAAISAGAGITANLSIYGRRAAAGLTRQYSVDYESGSVGSGAALSSGLITTSKLESLQILTEATTTGRTLVVSCMSRDGVNILFSLANVTVAASNKYLLTYRLDANVPSTEAANVTHIPLELCPLMKASIAATGAASAKLAVYGR